MTDPHIAPDLAERIEAADESEARLRPIVERWQQLEHQAEQRTADTEEDAFNIGLRDGFSLAVQLIDQLTGGDGEYRVCSNRDPDRDCPDPASMARTILARFPPVCVGHDLGSIAYAIIEGSGGIRAAEHAKDFQTANWTNALRSADAVIATIKAQHVRAMKEGRNG